MAIISIENTSSTDYDTNGFTLPGNATIFIITSRNDDLRIEGDRITRMTLASTYHQPFANDNYADVPQHGTGNSQTTLLVKIWDSMADVKYGTYIYSNE